MKEIQLRKSKVNLKVALTIKRITLELRNHQPYKPSEEEGSIKRKALKSLVPLSSCRCTLVLRRGAGYTLTSKHFLKGLQHSGL